ncbi:MAG: hypothetical protein NXI32_14655 [bacterium]|nr:hypothetical protein [bacterium]
MHARFYLGVEAIADCRYEDAKQYFQACREGKEFMFTVYFLSDLLLRHYDDWHSWRLETGNVELGNVRTMSVR